MRQEELDKFTVHGEVVPSHPGILYRRIVLEKSGLTVADISQRTNIPKETLASIFEGVAPITSNNAEELAKIAGNTEGFWLRSQQVYDAWMSKQPG